MIRGPGAGRRALGIGATLALLSVVVVLTWHGRTTAPRLNEIPGVSSGVPSPEAPVEGRTDRRLLLGELLDQVPLAGGETHRYIFDLEAGDYVEIRVEQQGIDISMTLRGSEGAELARTDSPNGSRGREEVAAVATSGGSHLLEIRGTGGAAPAEYSIHWLARRPAEEADRSRAHALDLLDRGEELRLRRQTVDAIRHFRQALEELETLNDPRLRGRVRLRLARCARAQGDLPQAFDLGRQALDDLGSRSNAIENATENSGLRADALVFMGLLHFDLERPEAAIEEWGKALVLRRASSDTEGQAQLLHNLGHAHQLLGESQRALEEYERSLELRESITLSGKPPTRGYGETLHNLGALEISLGEDERGRRHLEAATEVWQQLGDDLARARTLDRLGLADLAAGQPEAAAGRLETALALRRATNSGSAAAVSLANLALARRQQDRLDEAVALDKESLELFLAAGDRLGEARVRENLGRLDRDLERPQQALRQHRLAVELYRQLKDPAGSSSALGAMALDYRALGETEKALAAVSEALDLLETGRDQLHAAGLRRSFLASVADRYGLAVELLLDRADEEPTGPWALQALAANERARARGLLEALVGLPATAARALGHGTAQAVEVSLLEEEVALSASLSAAAQRRTEILAAGGRDGASVERVELRIEELAHRLDEARGERSRQRGESARYTEPLQANELTHWLAPGEILLEYRLGPEESYLWALTGDGKAPRLTTYRLPGVRVLGPLARRAHHLLAHSQRRETRGALVQVLCELQRLVLEPATERLESRKILVAADGPLHYVPFAALPDPRYDGPCEEAPPLVAAQSIASSASLSTRRAARRRPRNETRPALAVIADPDFGDREPTLPALPGTRREAQRLAALSPEPALVALGLEARKDLFTSGTLAPYRWLHLATHAQVDNRRPELSALVLATDGLRSENSGRLVPGRQDPEGKDSRVTVRPGQVPGRLFLHEIAGLDLRAELVTLSACRSGLGEEVRAAGLVGLRGAFLKAGARRVLVSLWDVPDDATAELMSRFYTALWLEDLDPAEALRRAQISFLAEPQRQAPHHWAAFVLSD